MRSLCEALFETCEKYRAKQAVADPGVTWTYDQLRGAVLAVAATVRQASSGDCVGILVPNVAAYPAAFYGVVAAGRLPVPLNYLLAPEELGEVVADAKLQTIVASDPFRPLAERLAPNVLRVERSLEQGGSTEPALAEPDVVATVLYTSGTTASPKGVELTHRNLLSCVEASIEHAGLEDRHRMLGVLPLFHSFALSATMVLPFTLGASVYYLPRFTPVGMLEAIAAWRLSVVLAVPSMYGALCNLKDTTRFDTGSLELCVSGGEPLAEAIRVGFEERFGQPLLEGYGLTETSPVVSINVPGARRPGTVGRPIRGVEFRIVDERDHPVPTGTHGEIWIRGPVVMRGYRARPDATAEVLTPDGWFRTGDLGFLDGDGYLSVSGRKKELIIVSGHNVYPQEIEQALSRHPAVGLAAAIASDDETRGQVPVAYVVLKPDHTATETELREFCREHLAGYKVPRQVCVRAELPMSPTGKVLKKRLREERR